MILEIYGIDYEVIIRAGYANAEVANLGTMTHLFGTESEMLKDLAELKELPSAKNPHPFIAVLERKEYKIETVKPRD